MLRGWFTLHIWRWSRYDRQSSKQMWPGKDPNQKFKKKKKKSKLAVHVTEAHGVGCVSQLLDRAVYTLEQYLQSSTRLQPSQVPVRMERAKERVLKVKKFHPASSYKFNGPFSAFTKNTLWLIQHFEKLKRKGVSTRGSHIFITCSYLFKMNKIPC